MPVLSLEKKVSLLISNMPILTSHLPQVRLSDLMFAKTFPIFLQHEIPGRRNTTKQHVDVHSTCHQKRIILSVGPYQLSTLHGQHGRLDL